MKTRVNKHMTQTFPLQELNDPEPEPEGTWKV